MSNHEKKQKKSIWLVALLLLLLLLAIAAVIYFFTPWFGGNEPSEPTETIPLDTSVPDENDEEVILYYNVDREEYAGKGDEGLTARTKDPDTGYYHINFAAKGRLSARRVVDRRIATKIDAQEVMSLIFDENGVVTGLLTVDECTGGYYMLGKHLFVSAADGNKLTLYGNKELNGTAYTLEYDSEAQIYDVSSLAAENGTQGQETALQEGDELLIILNKDGSVGWIYVVSRVKPLVTRTRWCDHCRQEVVWIEWEETDSLPLSGEGHYYLAEDVTPAGQASMAKNSSIVLDLNGHTVTGKSGNRIYSLHNEGAYLAIMDYSEKQTGKLVANAKETTNQGGCVWVRYGEFELFGGTLDGSNYSGKTSGMAVNVPKGSTFKMHGGKLIGGTSTAFYNGEKKAYQQGLGGAIYVGGTFDMDGGTITGGKATAVQSGTTTKMGVGGAMYVSGSGVVNMSGGVIENGSSENIGGNIYIESKSTFNMTGGIIRNGVCPNGGGNLFIAGKATFNMSGGEIVNGEITGKGKNGGSISLSNNGVMNMYGGWIYGGTARNCGGNMVSYGTFNMYGGNISNGRILDYETGKEKVSANANIFVVNSKMNMSGGEVNGHVQLINTTGKVFEMNLSGTAKITKSKDGAAGLYIPSGKTINVGTMKDGAEVYVTANGTFSTETAEANKSYFHCDVDGAQVDYFDKCLFVGRLQCVCGASLHEGHEHIGDCDGTLHAFAAWTDKKSLPTTEGYYYLANDVTMSAQAQVKTDATVALDLNGHTVKGKDGVRVYALWKDCKAKLYVTDSSLEQTGKLTISGEGSNQGGIFWFYGTDHTLTLYAGTFDASALTIKGNNGTVLNAASNGTTVNMYGGTIIGGTATVNEKYGGGAGGAIYLKNATFNLFDGTIKGGSAVNGGGSVYVDGKATFTMNGGTVIGGAATSYKNAEDKTVNGLGGNVFVGNSDATFNLNGGVVKDGTASGNGGNIKVTKGGVLNMNGGVVENGTTKDSGGNIVLYGTMTMTGGEINGGKKVNAEGKELTNVQSNVFVVNGKLDMSGGTIDGHMSLYGTHEINLSGAAKLKASDGGTSLNVPANNKINVGKMEDGAEVYVTASGIFSTETDAANAKYFYCDNSEQSVAHYDGCLAVGRVQCVCGASVNGGEHIGDCGGETHLYTAWTSKTELPTTPGYYYLTNDVKLSGQAALKTSGDLGIDLNGHTVTGKTGVRLFALWTDCEVSLSIADSSKEQTGKMSIDGSGTNQGMLFWLKAKHTVNLYGGTFDASAATLTGNSGAAINCGVSGATFNMYAGKLLGGTAAKNEKGNGGAGGALYLSKATFNMYGGSIEGGKAANGGNVYVDSGATFNFVGGTIAGGTATANGGNVNLVGRLELGENAQIVDGTAVNGGNVYAATGATFNMNGGKVENGTVTGKDTNGGNVCVESKGTFNMNNGTITGGNAYVGGNVAIRSGGKMVMENGTVENGTATLVNDGGSNGGNVYVANGGSFEMKNGALKSGTAKRGGNLGAFGTATLTGGTLEATNAGESNYNIFIYNNGNVTLDGVTVTGPTSEMSGITLYGEKGKTPKLEIKGNTVITENRIVLDGGGSPSFTMTGGTITSKSNKAISLSSANASFTMEGGEISSTNQNAVYLVGASSSFTMEGGKISSTNQNAVYLVGASSSFTMKGGEINISSNNAVCTEGKNATFTMTDGTITSTSINAVNLRGGDGATPKMTMTGGTIDCSNGQRAIIVQKGSATISGGTIKGGTTTADGGSIYVSSGAALELSGNATVTGGTAANGGNIYVADGGKVVMNGGTVSDGSCTSNGGNIYLKAKATFEMNGGSVLNGKATNEGGNFWNFGTIIMTGGKISGGAAKNMNGANINMTKTSNSVSVFTMSGGEIDGHVGLGSIVSEKTPTVTLYGTAKIVNKSNDGKASLSIPSGYTINVGIEGSTQMADGAEIYVTASGIFSNTTDEANAKYFHSDDASLEVVHYDGCLAIGRVQCVCGVSLKGDTHADHIGDCDGTLHAFLAWTDTKTLPSTAGYYYLTKDVKLTLQTYVRDDSAIVLDLNGKTVDTASNVRVYALWTAGSAKLSIADSVGSGTMITHTTGTTQGGIFWFNGNNHTLNLYGGTFDASASTATGTSGVAINSSATGTTINMYAGKLLGGTAAKNEKGNGGVGGAVYINNATFNMSGGSIEGGKAERGGNVYVDTAATFNMSGGSIEGGTAAQGGNVHVQGSATLKMSGNAEISGGTASSSNAEHGGGNVYLQGKMELSGNAVISGGKTTDNARGGNVYINGKNAEMTVSEKATVTGGSTERFGGNIYLHTTAGTKLTMNGGTIKNGSAVGTSNSKGGNLYVHENSSFVMTDGAISGGKVTDGNEKRGGNILCRGTMTVSGGRISGGTAPEGGNIYLEAANAQVTMTGGTISDGNATATHGGNVYIVYGGTFELKSGTVENGTAKQQGGNFYNRGKLLMSGGRIATNGTANDANIRMTGVNGGAPSFEMSGGEVNGAVAVGVYYTTNLPTVKLSGDAKIINEAQTSGVTLLSGKSADSKEVTANDVFPYITLDDNFTGKVFVDTNKTDGYKITSSKDSFENNIVLTDGWFKLYDTDGYVVYDGAKHRMQYICGASLTGVDHEAHGTCDGKLHLFNAWEKTDSLPLTVGYYYLTENVTLKAETALRINGELVLDLNGKTVQSKDGARIYPIWATAPKSTEVTYEANLTVCDSVGTGAMKAVGNGDQGRIFWLNGKHTLTIYGGAFDASAVTANNLAGVVVETGTTGSIINMYGGTIIGGDAATNGRNGGAVCLKNATFNMNGGTITGGKATNGGAVYVGENATFNMNGGKIENGTVSGKDTYGGNVCVESKGTFNMYDGTITGGNAYVGGNVAIRSDGKMVMENGTVENGTATLVDGSGSNGGNVYVAGGSSFEMKNGTLKSGTATRGGNLGAFGTATLTGGKLEATVATANNYNIFIYNNGNVTLDGVTVTGPKSEKLGISLYGEKNTIPKLTIKGNTVITENRIGLSGSGNPNVTMSGGTITSTGDKAITLSSGNASFTMTGGTLDCSAGKRALYVESGKAEVNGGTIIGGTTIENGGAVYLANSTSSFELKRGEIKGGKATNGGNIFIDKNALCTISGGTISGGQATDNGGNVYVDQTATFQMTNGTVENGTAAGVSGGGGNIYLNGNLTIDGGTVSGGKATAVDGESNGKGYGGNIFIAAGAEATLSTCTVTGGSATSNGGNIKVTTGGTLNMQSGVVENGTTENCGGNIVVYGKMFMTDGEIKGGKKGNAETDDSNVFIVDGTVSILGGTIDGHVKLQPNSTAGCDVTVSGSAKIISSDGISGITLATYTDSTTGSKYYSSVKLDGGFSGKVHLTATATFEGRVIATSSNGTFATNGNIVVGYNGSYFAFYENGEYKLYNSEKYRAQCVCGASVNGGEHIGDCNKTLHLFTAWTKTDSLPSTAGYYYLTNNVNLTSQTNLRINGTQVLDLDGHTVTGKNGGRIYAIWSTDSGKDEVKYPANLTISDSSADKTGKMTTTAASDSNGVTQGGVFWLNGAAAHTLNIYGGTFDASNVAEGYKGSGAAICADGANATLNMYGGTIIGGTTTGSGAAVCLGNDKTQNFKFNMSGNAEIKGGSAKNGGAVFLNPNVTMTMSGNATITGGTATTGIGGNIYIEKNSSLTLKENATVKDGTALANSGGNIFATGALTIENGTVSGGTATGKFGGNIYAGGTLTISGGTITGGTATGSSQNGGGNLYLSGQMTLSGNAVISDGKTTGDARGGNIYISGANAKMTMSGDAQITGGTTEKFGGNIYLAPVSGVTLTMKGGTISDGQAKSNGGNVYIHELATFNMEGGKLSDGSSGTDGGNVFGYGTLSISGEPHITGGKVNGSKTNKSANVCMTTNTKYDSAFMMTGGQIDGYVELRAGSKNLTATVGGNALIRDVSPGDVLTSGVMLTPNTSHRPYITVNEDYAGCLVVAVNSSDSSVLTNYTIVKSTDRNLMYEDTTTGSKAKLVVGNEGYTAEFVPSGSSEGSNNPGNYKLVAKTTE